VKAAVAASEERLRVTVASIGDAVIATDDEGRVTLINAVASALTGWTEPDAAGRPLDEVFVIVNEESRRPAQNPVHRVLREGVITGLANHTILVSTSPRGSRPSTSGLRSSNRNEAHGPRPNAPPVCFGRSRW